MAKRKPPRRPKGLARNPQGMMDQLQQIQQQVFAAQQELAEETVTASAGGGAVKVTMTGDQHCTAVEIAPEILEDNDVEMLQEMFLIATNSALEASRELAEQRLGPLTTGLDSLGLG